MSEPVLTIDDGGVCIVTLNRPARLNAINPALLDGLNAALARADADERIGAIVLTGAGRAFCAGDDLVEQRSMRDADEASIAGFVDAIQEVTRRIMFGDTPVVAAVRGRAVGGAFSWPANCDFSVWSGDARGFFPELKIGLYPKRNHLGYSHTDADVDFTLEAAEEALAAAFNARAAGEIWRGCASDRQGMHCAPCRRVPAGPLLPVAASYLHAGNHFRKLGSTARIDGVQDIQRACPAAADGAWHIPCVYAGALLMTESSGPNPRDADTGVDVANAKAIERIAGAQPVLVDLRPAGEVIPDLGERDLLHAGPPLSGWTEACGAMRGSIAGALVHWGIARDVAEAEELASAGEFRLLPANDHHALATYAGVISRHTPVLVVENRATGGRAFAALNEGRGRALRYGSNDAETLARLAWLEGEFAQMLGTAIRLSEGIDIIGILVQVLHMGDDGHSRQKAASALCMNAISPCVIEAGFGAGEVARAMRGTVGLIGSLLGPTTGEQEVVWYFPSVSDPKGRQGFVRVVIRSDHFARWFR